MEEKKYVVIDGKQTKIEDLTGQEFGILTVVQFDEEKYKYDKIRIKNKEIKYLHYYWICECNCGLGKTISIVRKSLLNGVGTNCGCLTKEIRKECRKKIFKKSFEEWCIENNFQSYLDLWDYELNKKLPSEIGSSSTQYFYFKCPINIHESELKKITNLTKIKNCNHEYKCTKCNSFAQWGIDNICNDFLEKYWDYDKNTINPWALNHKSNKKVWVKCQEKDYHDSYSLDCYEFTLGNRCPFCAGKKIHKLDSLGYLYPNVLDIWSDYNSLSPYNVFPKSGKLFWFKCENDIHKDYARIVYNANKFDFKCPECNCSKGENKISNFLVEKNIKYNSQQTFDNLIGVGNGLLSYDFFLKKYNLLIEYQGGQHEQYIEFFHNTYEDFENQQEHDRRKRQYAKDNNIKLLEIWYWDFDNIEEILKKELKIS